MPINARQALAVYIRLGVAHFLYKLLREWIKARRMLRMLKQAPQGKYADSVLGSFPALLENIQRRHDFVCDVVNGLPVCYWCIGPKWLPDGYMVLTHDPVVVKHILKDKFDNYTKGDEDEYFLRHLRMWLGRGIFVARHGSGAEDQGRGWTLQRKIAASIFTRANFANNMNEVFARKATRLCDYIRQEVASDKRIDMQLHFFHFTMDSIMEIFFGEAADTMGGSTNEYATAFDTAHRTLIEFMLKSALPQKILDLMPFPFGGRDGVAVRAFRNSHPLYREFKRAKRTLDVESKRLVAACRSDPCLAERKDLLAQFVQAEDREGFSTEWLTDLVLNFVIAGRDTTACALSWMFYILSTHPEIQAKVCAEIDQKLPVNTVPSFKALAASELPYLNGVLYEALRLYPPVPADGKIAIEDDVLPGGIPMPKDCKIDFLMYVMGRDPARYPDPETVKPERWIPFVEPSPYEFPVFQAGPRICLGMNMALFEAKLAAVMLLQQFSFELAPGEKISYMPTSLTMSICNSDDKSSHNLWLIAKERIGPAMKTAQNAT